MKKNWIKLNIVSPCMLIPLVLTGCTARGSLENKYNDYADKNQSKFLTDLSYTYHDYYKSDNLYCNSEAEAILMWTYGPGYTEWGTLLHQGREAEMETMPDIKTSIGIPSKFAPRELDARVDRDNLSFRIKDYKLLDKALSHSTAGKLDGKNVTVYHGYEFNEYELMETINDKLETKDILSLDPSKAKDIDVNSKLTGVKLLDKCWCATTLSKDFALGWANDNLETEDGKTLFNVPVYELTLDPSVHCAYVSYSRKKWFDGIYLAWPHEYQLLTERNLQFEISSAEWINRPNNLGNYLYIKCKVTK